MIYLFYGEDTYALNMKVREITQRFRDKVGSDIGMHRFGSENTADEVIEAAFTQGMFTEHNLVVLQNPSKSKPLIESLLPQLEQIPQETVFIIADPGIDKRSKWYKSLQKIANVNEFQPKSPQQRVKWAQVEAKRCGFELSTAHARHLVERVGEDNWQLAQEIKKLSHVPGAIDIDSINELVPPRLEDSIFDLLDALTGQKINQALAHYERLCAQGVHHLEILTMLAWQMRTIVVVSAGEGRSNQAIATDMGLNPYVVRKVSRTGRSVAKENACHLYQRIIETEHRLKSGGSVEPDALMEELIYSIGDGFISSSSSS